MMALFDTVNTRRDAGLPARVARCGLTGVWARFVAGGAERELGGRAEAMPHNLVSQE